MLLPSSLIFCFAGISLGQYIPTLLHPLIKYPGLNIKAPGSIFQPNQLQVIKPFNFKSPKPYISLGIELERGKFNLTQ